MSDSDPFLWSVDRSWGNIRTSQDGESFLGAQTKYHVDRGDSTAKCSRRILLNSIDGTTSVGFAGDIYADQPVGRVSEVRASMICRRCVPKASGSGDDDVD